VNSVLLFFCLAALKILALTAVMPAFFALRVKKIAVVIFLQILTWRTIKEQANLEETLSLA
jgi:hypothetical protein